MPDIPSAEEFENARKRLKKVPHPIVEMAREEPAPSKKQLNLKMKSKKLTILPEEIYKKEIDKFYQESMDLLSSKPLEQAKANVEEDDLFITKTLKHLKDKNKLTPEQQTKYANYRQNLKQRKQYLAEKINQFREENREILEKQSLKDSINRKLEELSLEDTKAIGEMLKSGKAIATIIINETQETQFPAQDGRSALLAAIQGFDKNKLKKAQGNEPSAPVREQKINITTKNPYQELLEMRQATAEIKLAAKPSKELKTIKNQLLELKLQLGKEMDYAKAKGISPESKASQITEIGKVEKVVNELIKGRREEERERLGIKDEINKKLNDLSLEDMFALNKLVTTSQGKKLNELIDLSGSQQASGHNFNYRSERREGTATVREETGESVFIAPKRRVAAETTNNVVPNMATRAVDTDRTKAETTARAANLFGMAWSLASKAFIASMYVSYKAGEMLFGDVLKIEDPNQTSKATHDSSRSDLGQLTPDATTAQRTDNPRLGR